MKKTISLVIILLVAVFLFTPPATARVGVGVNVGKIEVNEPLESGGIYHLPSLSVINTGDEPGSYELEVTYHEDQKELRPSQGWFSFDPFTFDLGAGEAQPVAINLTVPMNAKPGAYLAYLEAHPVSKGESGGVTIGIAAATKVYFTVKPGSVWQAFLNRITSYIEDTKPFLYVVASFVIAAVFIFIVRKFLSIHITFTKKK